MTTQAVTLSGRKVHAVPYASPTNAAQIKRNADVERVRASGSNGSARDLQALITLALITRFPAFLVAMVRSTYSLLQTGDASAKLRHGGTSIYSCSMPQHKVWLGETYLGNVCAKAANCIKTCIATTGHYGMGQSAARIWVRVLWHYDRALFLDLLNRELSKLNDLALTVPGGIAVRLNVTSDIRWERYIEMGQYANIQFYDYTKYRPGQRKGLAANYDLTYSVDDTWTVAEIQSAYASGYRMAMIVPFPTHAMETASIMGIPSWCGDYSDERFADPSAGLCLLYVKATTTKGADRTAIYSSGMVRSHVDLSQVFEMPSGPRGKVRH